MSLPNPRIYSFIYKKEYTKGIFINIENECRDIYTCIFFYNGIFRKYIFYLPMITARKHKNNSFIIRRYHFGKGTGPLRTPKVCINQEPVALFIYQQNQCITLLVPVTHDQVHCESLSWIGYIQLKAYHIVKNNYFEAEMLKS